MYQKRHVKPQRATPTIRIAMVWLAHGFRLAPRLGRYQARDLYPVASSGVPLVLAMAVDTGTATNSCAAANPDTSNGS
jgi:hypothetical protein